MVEDVQFTNRISHIWKKRIWKDINRDEKYVIDGFDISRFLIRIEGIANKGSRTRIYIWIQLFVLCNIAVLCSSVLVSGSRINPLCDKVSESRKRMKPIVYRCFRCTKEKLSCMHAKDHQDCTFAFSFVK